MFMNCLAGSLFMLINKMNAHGQKFLVHLMKRTNMNTNFIRSFVYVCEWPFMLIYNVCLYLFVYVNLIFY